VRLDIANVLTMISANQQFAPFKPKTLIMSLLGKLRPFYDAIFSSYQKELVKALEGSSSILDVGCGSHSPVGLLRGKARLVGIDAHANSVKKSQELGIHDEYYVHDVLKIQELFKAGSFDSVVALDLIEHLEKQDGLDLLDAMERIATKKVVVFTPNGFLAQGEYDSNPWQVHRSGWSVAEMKARGYDVIGINGWRPLRGELGFVKHKPAWFWIILSDISQLFVRNHSEKAFQILCVKHQNAAVTPGI
jgi:hypothetical protein